MITKETMLEAYEAVERINNEIYSKRQWPYENISVLSLTIVPASAKISTLRHLQISLTLPDGQYLVIYSSSNDDRIKYEKTDSYESWYKYIRRKWKSLREEYSSIKL